MLSRANINITLIAVWVTLLSLGLWAASGWSPCGATVLISELVAANTRGLRDEDGETSDWIELYNPGDGVVDLSGWCLTDDPLRATKWRFPAGVKLEPHGFLTVFCSGKHRQNPYKPLHANFKLRSQGEYVALVQSDGQTVEWRYSPRYPPQFADVSYGLAPGSYGQRFFETPTPGEPNRDGFETVANPPEVAVPGGIYTAAISVDAAVVSGAGTIRFTLDNSEPTRLSEPYSGPIRLTNTTVFKAKLFEPGRLPSRTVSRCYTIIDEALEDFTSNLPVVIINTFGGEIDKQEFRAADFLIFEAAKNDRSTLAEVPHFVGNGAIKKRGSSTINWEKTSLAIEIRDHNQEDMDVALLGMPEDSDWILHGPFKFDTALMRNAFVYELSNQLGRYAARTRFVEVFLNTSNAVLSWENYFGVYAFMEKIKQGKERVSVESLKSSDDSLPEIAGGYILKFDRPDPGDTGFRTSRGTPSSAALAYVSPKEKFVTSVQREWLLDYLDAFESVLYGPNFQDPELGYAKYIDVDSFIDHHIIQELTKNPDGLRLSTYMFKPRYGKLTSGPVWDFDRSMRPDNDGRSSNPVGWGEFTNYEWWGRLFEDPNYETRYAERWRELRRGPLAVENLHAIIDRMASELAEAQERNFQRWPLSLRGGSWLAKVDALKNWLTERVAWMDSQFLEAPVFSHSGGPISAPLELTMTHANNSGEILYTLNGPDPMHVSDDPASEALVFRVPIVIDKNTRVRARVRITPETWTDLTEAVYVVSPPTLAITEIMYNPIRGSDYEYVELYNFGREPIDLMDTSLSRGVTFDFSNSSFKTLLAGEYLVLVSHLEAFLSRYDTQQDRVAGEFNGNLDNRRKTLSLLGPLSEPIADFSYLNSWYPETDGNGHSLVLVDPTSSPSTWGNPSAWRPSRAIHGSPGADDLTASDIGGQVPGDINQDGRLSLDDAVVLLGYLFKGTSLEFPCGEGQPEDLANRYLLDSSGDSAIDIGDVVHNLVYLFLGGPPPIQGKSCQRIAGCPDVCSP